MDDQLNKNKNELWNLSVRDIFYKYVRFLPLFLLSLAFALLIAWIYLRYATRIYGAGGTMAIKNEQTNRSNDKVEDLLSGTKSENIQNEIEILKSTPLMERVVKSYDLNISYTAIGKIKEFNVYKQGPFLVDVLELDDSTRSFSMKVKFVNNNQFRINGGTETFTLGQVFKNASFGVFRLIKNLGVPSTGSEYSFAWQQPIAVASALAGGVRVMPKTPGTNMLIIGYQTTNGYMAADIVNGLMVQYDSMTVEQNNFSTDQMIGFIDSRLDILEKEIDTLQLRLLEYQQRYHLVDIEAQSSQSFANISDAEKAIYEKEARIMLADDIGDYLKDKKNQFNVAVPSALGLEDATLNAMIGAYNTAQLKRQLLIDGNVPTSNPQVVETEGQIEKIRQSVLENLKNIRASHIAAINIMKRRSGTENTRLQGMPYILRGQEEMVRQINAKQALFNLLQGKREEAAIGRASTISNSKIIDKALPSTTPVKPNKRAIQILAVLIGIGLPAVIIFIGEVVNDKVTTRFDIEKITAAPILGEVGHSYSDSVLIVNKTSRSMVAEQFRIVRSNLQYILPKAETNTILVTSSFSGEGKSFVSTNMGAVLSLTGKKTIILEFDIRKPKVLSGLNMSKRSGISNYLLGKSTLEELVIPVPDQENLFVLPCGPIPPNPSELLLDTKVDELFAWLKTHFDVVIIDTAPVGMVSDAMTLGKYADCTLYLVRQGHTFKKQVALIDEFYKEKKLPKVAIVINDVKVKPGYGYYGYGRYGYGYGYGQKSSYYVDETPPESKLEKFLQKFDPRTWFGKKKKRKRSNQ
jgi:capsular exopolysaccharide synthesis family protein